MSFFFFLIEIDIRAVVLRDYGISTGFSNNNSWTRRELHIGHNGYQTRISLWNALVQINMIK